jgi:hypothetical protein
MSTGRTTGKWTRVYGNGYDWSGFSRDIGPLEITYDEHDLTAYMSDTVKGYMKGHAHVNVGTLNAVFDNTATTGIHAQLQAAGSKKLVTVAIGQNAPPADGDECFNGEFIQGAYQVATGGAVTVSVPFQGWAGDATYLQYASPWGTILHAKAIRLAATGVNDQIGFDNPTGGATSKGAIFVIHVFAGNGTANLLVQDAAVNNDGGFVNIPGGGTGLIDCAVPQWAASYCSGALGAIRQYVRWQIAFGTATTVTFFSALRRIY